MKPTTKINVNNICSIEGAQRISQNDCVIENKHGTVIMSYPTLEQCSCVLHIKMNNGDLHVKMFSKEVELKSFELEITERPKNLSNFIEI